MLLADMISIMSKSATDAPVADQNESTTAAPVADQNESTTALESQCFSQMEDKTVPLKSVESFIYYFDTPDVHVPGSLSVYEKVIVFSFPKITLQSANSSEYFHTNPKNVQLIINKQMSYSSQWIPIYTQQDWYRLNDMIQRGYQEFLKQSYSWILDHHDFLHGLHHEKKSTLSNDHVSITATENVFNTVINLDIENDGSTLIDTTSVSPVHVQIYFGDDLFVCTKSILSHLDSSTIHNLISFILSKLVKW